MGKEACNKSPLSELALRVLYELSEESPALPGSVRTSVSIYELAQIVFGKTDMHSRSQIKGALLKEIAPAFSLCVDVQLRRTVGPLRRRTHSLSGQCAPCAFYSLPRETFKAAQKVLKGYNVNIQEEGHHPARHEH